jgi:TPR repeat protein
MEKNTSRARRGAGAAALLCALAAPLAHAGPAEDSALAETEFARGDLVAALALWQRAAALGYAPAQARLGDILDKSEEDEEAVLWYRKAAAQDNAAGEYGLGQMYAKGEGVPKDQAQALAHTLRAARLNHVAAVTLMMEAYRAGGLGLAPDAAEAAVWEARLVALVPGARRAVAKAADKGKKKDAR